MGGTWMRFANVATYCFRCDYCGRAEEALEVPSRLDIPTGVNSDRYRLDICQECAAGLLSRLLVEAPAWKRRHLVETEFCVDPEDVTIRP